MKGFLLVSFFVEPYKKDLLLLCIVWARIEGFPLVLFFFISFLRFQL